MLVGDVRGVKDAKDALTSLMLALTSKMLAPTLKMLGGEDLLFFRRIEKLCWPSKGLSVFVSILCENVK